MPTLKRAAFLGLDGVPYTLVTDLIKRGVMPNLAAIVAGGALMKMETAMPEVSSVAWTSFMTGVNPGRHGIYGFMELKPGGYGMYFPNYGHMKADTLWDRLGGLGGRSVVINLPSTYPARPLNGMMTAGFVALDLKKATYPDSAYQYLSGIGYKIDVDTVKARESLDFLISDLKAALDTRKEAILHFLEHDDWELFIGVITETDRLHHFLWKAYMDSADGHHGFFLEFYRELDSFIGEFAGRLDKRYPGTPLMLMSDHGFTYAEHQVYINHWLRENGFQKLDKTPAGSFEDIASGTRAFALDPSRVYIHVKDKYPRGTVNPGSEYDRVIAELKAGLLSLEIEGRPVIKSVHTKGELYSGPESGRAPDLVLLSNYGFDLKGAVSKEMLHDKGPLTGMHTQDDAMLVLSGDCGTKGISGTPTILDAAATLSRLLGLPTGDMEGRPL